MEVEVYFQGFSQSLGWGVSLYVSSMLISTIVYGCSKCLISLWINHPASFHATEKANWGCSSTSDEGFMSHVPRAGSCRLHWSPFHRQQSSNLNVFSSSPSLFFEHYQTSVSSGQFFFSFLIKKKNKKQKTVNWRTGALQCCVDFCHTSAWISHGYRYVPSLLNLPPTSHPIPPLSVVTE